MVTSRSRLVRIKNSLTIPRAELNGLLLCELFPSICHTLKSIYVLQNTYFWIDSSLVFCWVKNENKINKPHVQRRLEKIRHVITVSEKQLILVPRKSNPADVVAPLQLKSCHNVNLTGTNYHAFPQMLQFSA